MRFGTCLRLVLTCCVVLQCASATAQPGAPEPVRAYGLASLDGGLSPLESVPVLPVPGINAAALAAAALEGPTFGPLPVASVFRTTIVTFSDAWGLVEEWLDTDGARMLTWRLRIAPAGATSVGLGFTRYYMPPGGRLLVFTPDYDDILGPFTDANNEAHGELWLPPLPGADIIVELSVPEDALDDLQVEVGAVERGFLDPRSSHIHIPPCQTDVVCPDAARYGDAIRSVANVLVTVRGVSYGCTGALINNTRGDRTPYFLTAYHCGGPPGDFDYSDYWTSRVAASVRVFWNHHSARCGDRDGHETRDDTPSQQMGSTFIAGHHSTDFALLKLSDVPQPTSTYRQHYAGWNRDPTRYLVVAGIHHPAGTSKSVAWDDGAPYGADVYPVWAEDPKTGNLDWRHNFRWCNRGDHCDGLIVYWDKGQTTSGSSGSPLFNGLQQILGQLWSGDLACGDPDSRPTAEDRGEGWSSYGWVKSSWEGEGTATTRLRDWLDPTNRGDLSIHGIDALDPPFNLTTGSLRFRDVNGNTITEASPEQRFVILATVRNGGLNRSKSTRLQFYYLSETLPIGWTPIGEPQYVGPLSPNRYRSESLSLVAPTRLGRHIYGACVRLLEEETDKNDNCSGVAITVRPGDVGLPDLVVRSVTVSDSTPTVGQNFRLRATVANVGTGGAPSTKLWYWQKQPGRAWTWLGGSDSVGAIRPGYSRSFSRLVTGPATAGTYQYTACVETVEGEPSDSNCFRPYVTVNVLRADEECRSSLGTVTSTVTRASFWTSACRSEHYDSSLQARYYSFTVGRSTTVTIDLTSRSADAWLALRNGSGIGVGLIASDNNGGEGTNARIRQRLAPGTYTIEATTASGGQTGPFWLSLATSSTEYEITIEDVHFDRVVGPFDRDDVGQYWQYWVRVTARNTGRRPLSGTPGASGLPPWFLTVSFFERNGTVVEGSRVGSLSDLGGAPWNPGERRMGWMWQIVLDTERSSVDYYRIESSYREGEVIMCVGCEEKHTDVPVP